MTIDGDLVVIVEDDQLAKAPVTGQRRSFARHTFHVATVAHDGVRVVVNQSGIRLVESRRQVLFAQRQTNGVAKTHTERTSGDFDTVRNKVFRVTRGHGVPLSEVLQVVVRDGRVASQVHQRVLQHATVTGRQDKSVSVRPREVFRVVVHRFSVQDVRHRRAAHGQTRVTGVGLVDGIDGQESDRVDRVLDGIGGNTSRCLRLKKREKTSVSYLFVSARCFVPSLSTRKRTGKHEGEIHIFLFPNPRFVLSHLIFPPNFFLPWFFCFTPKTHAFWLSLPPSRGV